MHWWSSSSSAPDFFKRKLTFFRAVTSHLQHHPWLCNSSIVSFNNRSFLPSVILIKSIMPPFRMRRLFILMRESENSKKPFILLHQLNPIVLSMHPPDVPLITINGRGTLLTDLLIRHTTWGCSMPIVILYDFWLSAFFHASIIKRQLNDIWRWWRPS